MKKLLAFILIFVLILSMTACASETTSVQDSNNTGSASNSDANNSESQDSTSNAEIALVLTAEGTVDDRSFYERTYDGIERFASDTGHSCAYYNPSENSVDALCEVIDVAKHNGAKVICMAGAGFSDVINSVFDEYSDLVFICNELIGVTPSANAVINIYRPQEAAFLAGVSAVYEGYTKIGVVGGKPFAANINALYGFVQGVNWAAGNLDVKDVSVNVWYSNSWEPNADIQAFAAAWYDSGIELIAGLGGSNTPSVLAAAEATDGAAIGCDVDMSYLSETVITSSLKDCDEGTYQALMEWENGTLQYGQIRSLGLKENCVGLEMENARFEKFTQNELDTVIEKYLAGEIEILDYSAGDTPLDRFDALSDHNITFNYIE